MNYLITGAQFNNKGAQSLLFTAVNEIRKKDPESKIFYIPIDYDSRHCFDHASDYQFSWVLDDESYHDHEKKMGFVGLLYRKHRMKKRTREVLGNNGSVLLLSKVWPEIDVLFDVSGYILSSKFSIRANNRFLRHIEKASSLGIDVFLMPQSFGPFDYAGNKEKMISRIASVLNKANLIYAREEQARQSLVNEIGLKDVRLSTDLVLQSEEVDLDRIYKNKNTVNSLSVSTKNNVGIVPNTQTFKFGDETVILQMYRRIIDHLCESGKEVYIFKHSNDAAACKKIYEQVKDNSHCHLILEDMDCIAYSRFVSQFDYIIASRYHALVHAYREMVPAMVLGWSVKYVELAKLLDQERFVFDITGTPDTEKIIGGMEYLNDHFKDESAKIKERLGDVQKRSVFNECWDYINERHKN